jgi:hypothetical protein
VLSVFKAAYSNVVTLRLPAKAVNWTGGFEFEVVMSLGLNLSSMYGIDEQGNNIQTWYWLTNVSYVRINEAVVANPFLYVHFENLSVFGLEGTLNESRVDFYSVTHLWPSRMGRQMLPLLF